MSPLIKATGVLFDWDGTLLNSFRLSYHASIKVLQHFGIKINQKRFLETYSPNWYDSYKKLGLSPEQWDNADRIWRKNYLSGTAELFPFTHSLLTKLKNADLKIGLVTSGDRGRVSQEIKVFDLEKFFTVIVCSEDTLLKKPHPEPLSYALQKLSLHAKSTVYVGDRPEDIVMGKSVGSYTVGVESDYGSRSLLEQACPDLILPDASHLTEALELKSL